MVNKAEVALTLKFDVSQFTEQQQVTRLKGR